MARRTVNPRSATLTLAFAGHDGPFEEPMDFNEAMDKLDFQVTARGDDLLPTASAEQLTTMRDMFGGFNWPADYPRALAKVVVEMENRAGLSSLRRCLGALMLRPK